MNTQDAYTGLFIEVRFLQEANGFFDELFKTPQYSWDVFDEDPRIRSKEWRHSHRLASGTARDRSQAWQRAQRAADRAAENVVQPHTRTRPRTHVRAAEYRQPGQRWPGTE